jgi:DNA replication protein DnaC
MEPIKIDLSKIINQKPRPDLHLSEPAPEPAPQPLKPWANFEIDRHPDLKRGIDQVIRWYRDDQGAGAIVLFGHPGCGKTSIAQIITRAWGIGAKLYPEPKLLSDIRTLYSQGGDQRLLIEQTLRMNMLCLDDIGASHVKAESFGWLHDIYWQLLDGCINKPMPLIITTNMTTDELFNWIGPRAEDRLIQMIGKKENMINLFNVPSYRRKWMS